MQCDRSDVAPWERVQAQPQTADDVTPAYAGTEAGGEGSPWYVGDRYYSDYRSAAVMRQVRDARRADLARRAATYRRAGA